MQTAIAVDWPTFGHDARRSQATDEQLELAKLSRAWSWQSPQPPLPAWGQPAKGDAFANLKDFASMRNYDPAFHPIVAGDALYFGSNVDDSVRCLDAATGNVRWAFTAGGPVRIAPTFADGRIYFGADDGFAYCLAADTGKLIWRFCPSENQPSEDQLREDQPQAMVLNNGRLISYWPCRTGVLVAGETAYFGCSLLPWRTSYLCAVDAKTGKPDGDGRYVREFNGVTFEGPLVAGGDLLYAPQGREAPMQFQIADGKHIGTLRDGFGAFCVLTPDNRLLHGPRKKGGGIVDSNALTRAPVATHKDARAMIVNEALSLMLTNTELAAADLKARSMKWKIPIEDAAAMMLASEHVFLGRKDRVVALSTETGKDVWHADVDGRVYGVIAASGALIVSSDTGQITCFRSRDVPLAQTDESQPSDSAEAKPPSADKDPQPIAAFSDEHLLGRWVFSPLTLEKDSRNQIRNLAGDLPATISGPVQFQQHEGLDGIALDGKSNSLLLTDDITTAKLPKREMTAEAWVRVDQLQEWGGLVGATQDNGNYERGWLLGFRQQKFSLSLVGKDATAKLTYLNADKDFQLGQWHHVVGTYDGATMRLYVDGQLSASSTEQRGDILYPPKTFYEIAAYHDDNEYYRTNGMVHEVRVYDRVLSAKEVAAHFAGKPIDRLQPLHMAVAPWAQFDGNTSAIVRFETLKPSAAHVVLQDDAGASRTFASDKPAIQHAVRLTGLKRDRRYSYVIEMDQDDRSQATREYELDTYFNYHLAPLPKLAKDAIVADDEVWAAADFIEANYPRSRGLCFVIGSGEGDLAIELARRGNLRVVGLETDVQKLSAARKRAVAEGIHGPRCSFTHVDSLNALPIPDRVANLVVTQVEAGAPLVEIARILQPKHGRMIQLGTPEKNIDAQLTAARLTAQGLAKSGDSLGLIATRDTLPDAGDWTHMYGDATNAAYTGEALGGVTATDQLSVAWLGLPGPRYQTDRQPRKSAPLSASGRLYMQGQERVIALDAHNGQILWALEAPGLLRFNIPRDASNWCCDEDFLYVALSDRLWQIDGETGSVVKMHGLAGASEAKPREWGYVARSGPWLLGSAVRPRSMFVEFWGKDFWFDQKSGVYTDQVCSESLFARNFDDGARQWKYDGGLIWNATITVSVGRTSKSAEDGRTRKSALQGGQVYFIESRGVELADEQSSRLPVTELTKDAWLVGLDLNTGKRIWQQKLDISPKTSVANMAYSDGTLVLVTSFDNKCPVRTFAAADGKPMWDANVRWPRNHHGGHLSRPAIVEGGVFVRPAKLELKTGRLLSNNMPGGGCGTYVCSRDALFFRAGSGRQLSTWHPETGRYTHWQRMRPDCWLSTIPAGGMLLSPEGGGGCSCGHWMEMSVGFVPKAAK